MNKKGIILKPEFEKEIFELGFSEFTEIPEKIIFKPNSELWNFFYYSTMLNISFLAKTSMPLSSLFLP